MSLMNLPIFREDIALSCRGYHTHMPLHTQFYSQKSGQSNMADVEKQVYFTNIFAFEK